MTRLILTTIAFAFATACDLGQRPEPPIVVEPDERPFGEADDAAREAHEALRRRLAELEASFDRFEADLDRAGDELSADLRDEREDLEERIDKLRRDLDDLADDDEPTLRQRLEAAIDDANRELTELGRRLDPDPEPEEVNP